MKKTVLQNALFKKIAALIEIPKNINEPLGNVQLKLSCMRFFRACIAKNEPWYKKRMINFHILDSAVNLFCHTRRSNNLLNSCFLSMVHPLINKNTRSQYPELRQYVVERYLSRLEKVDSIFSQMRKAQEEDLAPKDTKKPSEKETSEPAQPSDDDKESEEMATKSVSKEKTQLKHDPQTLEMEVLHKRKRRRSESPLDFSKKQKISHCP